MSTLTLDTLLRLAETAARADPDIARRLRLWAADCAARALHIYETSVPGDDRVRQAIIVTRQFARGEIDATALSAAERAAWEVNWDAAREADWFAARAALWAAAEKTAENAVWVAKAATKATPDNDGRAAEQAWQIDRLCAWMSDPEPADWPLDAPETTITAAA